MVVLVGRRGQRRRSWSGLNISMILKQFYLNCLAHASYLVGDESSGIAGGRRPAARRGRLPGLCRGARAAHRARLPDALPCGLSGRPSRAARPDRRDDLPGRRRPRGVRLPSAARRRVGGVRPGADDRARNARPHAGIDQSARLRPGGIRHHAEGRPDRRHAVCRRRRPAGSARRAGMVGGRPRRSAVYARFATSCCRCPTRASSTRPTARDRSAARRSAGKRSRRSASSGDRTTRCSR